MTFLHPGILAAGLLAIAIPILIHLLLRRRRRPVEWAAMQFLLEAYRKRRRKLTLEQLVLLVARCLLVALLGGAIAGPILGGGLGGGSGRLLVVVVDNSAASGVRAGSGTELDRSVVLANEGIDALDPARGDRVAVVSLATPARAVIAEPTADTASVRRAIEAMRPTDAGPDWAGALAEAARLAGEGAEAGGLTVLIASSLRAGSAPLEKSIAGLAPEGTTVLAPSPEQAPAPSTSVVSFVPGRRVVVPENDGVGGLSRAIVGLRRSGRTDLEVESTTVRVREATSDTVLGRATVRWDRGQRERAVAVSLDPAALARASGRVLLRAEIDPDALVADDTRLAGLESRPALRVGIVGVPSRRDEGVAGFVPADWARLALEPDERSGFETRVIDPGAVSRTVLSGLDAALVLEPGSLTQVAWDALGAASANGVLVVLTPGARSEAVLWAEAAGAALGVPWTLEREPATHAVPLGLSATPRADADPLLGLVAGELGFLLTPVRVSQSISVREGVPGSGVGRVLLESDDGRPWMVASNTEGGGTVVLLGSALDPGWTDLAARPLIVPLLQEVVRQGVGRNTAPVEAIAGREGLVGAGSVRLAAWSDGAGPASVGLDVAGRPLEPIRHSGAWLALGDDDQPRGSVIVHADTDSTDTTPLPADEVGSWLATTGAEVKFVSGGQSADGEALADSWVAGPPGRSLAWLVLIGAGVLALGETYLARRSSHAEVSA